VIYIPDAHFDETGELTTSKVCMGLNYNVNVTRDEMEGEEANIIQSFTRTMKKGPNGETSTEMTVEHELFELPTAIMGRGIAAEVTRASLKEYDKMEADAIILHANIDQGGYAWASYGYGWDTKNMSEEHIKTLIINAKRKILNAFKEAGITPENPNMQKIIDILEEAEHDVYGVTPQLLARIGKDGPFLRKGKSGTWYTEENYQQAIAEGRESGDLPGMKGPLHAGKIGLLGSNWFGRVDLKHHGPQEGKNRKLLEQKINSIKHL